MHFAFLLSRVFAHHPHLGGMKDTVQTRLSPRSVALSERHELLWEQRSCRFVHVMLATFLLACVFVPHLCVRRILCNINTAVGGNHSGGLIKTSFVACRFLVHCWRVRRGRSLRGGHESSPCAHDRDDAYLRWRPMVRTSPYCVRVHACLSARMQSRH